MSVTLYKVGGYVRDSILGIKSKDIDYSVEADSYDEMREYIIANGGKIFLETPEYFTIRAKLNNEDADFVLCRKDGAYKNARHPDSVQIGTIDDDLARRDFTINAIAIKEDGFYYDPFNGLSDIKAKIIKCVGNTGRLKEDGLRIIRAMRFKITKGFELDRSIIRFIDSGVSEELGLIRNVSSERIADELNKMFAHDMMESIFMFKRYSAFWEDIFYYKTDLKAKFYTGR